MPTAESKNEDFDDDMVMVTPKYKPLSFSQSIDLATIDPYDPSEPKKPDQYPVCVWDFVCE